MKKLTAEQKLLRALATLDNAVQDWYKECEPNNKEHYASVHIRDYPVDKTHVSAITLQCELSTYKTLHSSKHKL